MAGCDVGLVVGFLLKGTTANSMAESTKKKTKSKTKSKTVKKTAAPSEPVARNGKKWDEALQLETCLEEKLLEDAIMSAKMAIHELEEETRKLPFERRSGLRLREKAIKTENAFNRLRALRKGELLPPRQDDE